MKVGLAERWRVHRLAHAQRYVSLMDIAMREGRSDPDQHQNSLFLSVGNWSLCLWK